MLNLFNRLFPSACLVCNQVHHQEKRPLLCDACFHELPWLDKHSYRCRCCSLPLTQDTSICSECLSHPPTFSSSIIAFGYTYPLDFLLQDFKFHHRLMTGHLLAQLLAEKVLTEKNQEHPDLLIPIPMHWRNRWLRGFNQTEFLARDLGRCLRLPVAEACEQLRPTPSQKHLNRTARQQNRRDLFRVRKKQRKLIQDSHIALIDDVVTTTATTRCLSELLIAAGARRVDIWALARTPNSR
jgi:ComF family protein